MPAAECPLHAGARETQQQEQNALSLYPHSWHVLAKELQQHDGSIGVMGENRKR